MPATDHGSLPAIAERLLVVAPDGVVTLLGGRERASGQISFPMPDDETRYEMIELPRYGTLWSWTIQRFRPKSPPYAGPENFVPYAVGYVQLANAIIVEGRLTGLPFEALHIDMPMQVVAESFPSADGTARLTHAFAPVGENR